MKNIKNFSQELSQLISEVERLEKIENDLNNLAYKYNNLVQWLTTEHPEILEIYRITQIYDLY